MQRLAFLLSLSVALAAPGCGTGTDPTPVIATVQRRQIRRAEFDRFLKLRMGELNLPEASDPLLSEMLDEYLRRRVVLDEAHRIGLAVTDAEIDQAAHQKPQMKGTAAGAIAREELARDLLVEKYYRQVVLRDVRVSPEEIQRYVEQNQSRLMDRPGFYVREIRVQRREDAERIRTDVTDGKRDFASAALEQSDAPNALQGGLARYNEGELPAVLERAIRPLQPGDISPVVESNFGYHIFKLERRVMPLAAEDRRAQLDERRQQLGEELVARRNQQAVEDALARLVSAAAITIDQAALGFTYTGRLGQN